MATPAESLRSALAGLAAEELEAVIAEARQQARQRVRDQLADQLTETMLEQAGRRLAPRSERPERAPRRTPAASERTAAPRATAPASGGTTARPEASPDGSALYAYCVVSADTVLPRNLPSIDPAASPTLLRHGDLAAVVSEVPLSDFGEERLRERLSDMEWLERTARAHELSLETIGRHATLIPMRLCSLYRSRDGVIAMLGRESAALRTALADLEGKSEWGVKAFASLPPRESTPASGDSGTDYMQRRRADRDRRRSADQQQYEMCLAIHERLSDVVADALTSPPQRPEVSGHPGHMLLNGVYLVEDDQRTQFLELVDQLRGEHLLAGIELQATGPWPAYNFVPGTIGAAW